MARAPWILILLAACAEASKDRPIEVPPGGVAIIAVYNSLGVLDAAVMRPGTSASIARPIEASIAAWVIDPAQFLGSDGAPLPAEMISGLTVRLVRPGAAQIDPAPAGSCRRCLALDDEALPHVVHRGSSCPPPKFSEYNRPDFVPNEAARIAVRLEWPGECECVDQPLDLTPEPFDDRFVLPEDVTAAETEPYFAVVEGNNGNVALFDREQVTLITRDGSAGRSVLTDFMHYPLLAAALEDGSFFVFEHLRGTIEVDFRAWTFTPQIEPLELFFPTDEQFFPVSLIDVAGSDHFALTGTHLDPPLIPFALTASCEVRDDRRVLCRNLLFADVPGSIGHRDPVLLDNGALIGFAENHWFALSSIPPPAAIARADPANPRDIETAIEGSVYSSTGAIARYVVLPEPELSGDLQEWRFLKAQRSIAYHNRVFVCATVANLDQEGVAVISREIDPSFFEPTADRSQDGAAWQPGYCTKTRTCLGFERVGDEVHAYFEDHEAVTVMRFAADGTRLSNAPLSCSDETREPFTLERRLRRVHQRSDAPAIFETRDRALFERDGAGFRRIFGPETTASRIGGAVSLPEGVYGFGDGGRVTFLARDEQTWRDLPPLDSPLDWISGAAAIGEREALIAGVSDEDGVLTGWVQRVAPAQGGARSIGRPIRTQVGDRAFLPIDLTAVAPGVALIAAHRADSELAVQPVLLRFRGDEVQEVKLDLTPDPPDDAERPCRSRLQPSRFPLSGDTTANGIRGVDGKLGYAWATGCNSTLFFVHALSEPPIGRYINARERLQLPAQMHFYAVGARCPDDAVFVSDGDNIDTTEGQFFRIGPTTADASELVSPIRNLDTTIGDRTTTLGGGTAFEMLPFKDRMIAVYGAYHQDEAGGTVFLLGGSEALRTRDSFSAAIIDQDRAVIFGENLRVTTIHPE